jgi:sugar transferase EpsL
MAKRTLDVVVAAVALTLLAPLLLVVSAVVKFSLGPPVFFRQVRPGLHGQRFTLVKFRTMREPLADGRELFDEEERLTRVGRFLRTTSLDELPELFNVLRGDMSLVGPRPLLVEYLDRYSPEQARRHEVRPGITGWSQVHGRNAVAWEERFRLDVEYVERQSLWFDLRILALTVRQVLRLHEVKAPGHVTAPAFMGGESSHSRTSPEGPRKPVRRP